MYSPLAPILPTDDAPGDSADALAARIDALQVVLAATARLAGGRRTPIGDDLSSRADLASTISQMSATSLRDFAREMDSLGIALHAGLLALERARKAGRLNKAAAALLHAECSAVLAERQARVGAPQRG